MKEIKLNHENYPILIAIINEYTEATMKFGSFASAHEGYAVIKKELDELWDCIKNKACEDDEMRKEAIQVAAMAYRFLKDCCYWPTN